ncbi:preprotein translocase subunit SecY [Actinobacteria bacterium YIM 96077]|uniref:Protein translocase subunit SecY n=1 Tax=Phytoactinopolyspora halophila TaxID=1981511 RepID=A0A329QBL4_9ACTN|nr:preprotein translocase subunit SecY [Phytoactinopolyspora halophila]AYY14726.1 preprotein translocase subunit SecY [Actinobacteria bacterium YIM 96077]RAW09637.1 preprotein translocase subunit SecY [Phytoactinopolyspora halophila]
MLRVFVQAFRTPDLRQKLLFMLGIIVLFRLGSNLPTPNVDVEAVQICSDQALEEEGFGLYGLLNLFTGGALLNLAIFALGIIPYITSAIIFQLLTVVIPKLETLKKEGPSGQAQITQYTRYLTIGLALLQATTLVTLAESGQFFPGCPQEIVADNSVGSLALMVLVMTSGTALVMWMGELISDRGVGNGMSLLIFTQIVASVPGMFWNIQLTRGWGIFALVLAVALVVVALIVYVELSQRRIPVQYAKRMVGRRMYGGSSTYIPLKINQAGVIPVIFASSLLYVPMLWAQFNQESAWAAWVAEHFQRGDHPIYLAFYFLLIVGFAFFYVSITFNPKDVSDNMKRYGGFVPGIRAGRPTEEYLTYILNRITSAGAIYLGLVALLPLMAFNIINPGMGMAFSNTFGGTSILIMVGVGLQTVQQIEGQLQQRNYEGFLK